MAHFEEKNIFCYYLSLFTGLIKKIVYTKNKFSPGFAPIQSCWAKQSFCVIPSFFLRYHFFWLKMEVFSEFTQKCFKTTGTDSLAACGSYWGEIVFWLRFVPFYKFEQKQLFTPNTNFPMVFNFSSLLMKTNFQIISELLSVISRFWPKREVFSEFPRKIVSKQQESIV